MRGIPILFCFPFAGGTADFYNELESACGGNVRFVKLEYSGHGKRMKEPLCHSFSEVTSDLYPQITRILKEVPDVDYALMGYSMGSVAAFDVLQRICKDEGVRKPKCVFLSAHQPQPLREFQNVPECVMDERVKARTIAFGGIDERLFDNKSFWRLYLPIFRADYEMIASYEFDTLHFRTPIPAVVFYSQEDTPLSQMQEWEKYFTKNCVFVRFSGQHFFIHTYYKEMAEVIQKRLACACAQGGLS